MMYNIYNQREDGVYGNAKILFGLAYFWVKVTCGVTADPKHPDKG